MIQDESFLFHVCSFQTGDGRYPHCPDTCEQGGQQRRVFIPQTNATAQLHSHQEARPQICMTRL